MYIFLDKSSDIGLDPGILDRVWSEPLIADESLLFARSRFVFTSIFDEKQRYLFVDERSSFEVARRERIVDRIHEFDDFEI
jgi:hypothetical protein